MGVTEFPSIIHPSVDLHHTSVGDATVIQEGCVLGPGVRVGENCLLSFRVVVAHESTVGDSVVISPGVIINGRVRVDEGAFLGAGCIILTSRSVGGWSIVGAGSTATEDVPAHTTVFGVPARVIQIRNGSAQR